MAQKINENDISLNNALPLPGNAGVPSTPASGNAKLFGVGTSNVRPGWMNQTGTSEKLLSDGGGVTSYTNTGTAGGTGYYMNIGPLKMCWGSTNSLSCAAGTAPTAASYGINFPASFFSSIQSAQITAAPGTATNTQFIYVGPNSAVTTSGWAFYLNEQTGSSGATSSVHWFVIGT